MPDLTNELKLEIMELAFQVVCNDEAIAADEPKDKAGISLYHAMIKAITQAEE